MKKRTIILTALHFILMGACVMFSVGASMEAFDDPDYQSSAFEGLVSGLADILMQPGSSLWASSLPDAVEWGLCFANSLLWGLVFVFLVGFLVQPRRNAG
jgi:chromate transport protein ChrA